MIVPMDHRNTEQNKRNIVLFLELMKIFFIHSVSISVEKKNQESVSNIIPSILMAEKLKSILFCILLKQNGVHLQKKVSGVFKLSRRRHKMAQRKKANIFNFYEKK